VNYNEKLLTGGKKLSCSFYLYRFRKYVSYGFPIINSCNPGVHSETPCISGIAKRAVNFNESEIYLLAKFVGIFNSLTNPFKTDLLLSNYHPNFPPEKSLFKCEVFFKLEGVLNSK